MSEEIEANVIWIPFEIRLVDQEKIKAIHDQIEQDNKKLKEMGDKTPREQANNEITDEGPKGTVIPESEMTPGEKEAYLDSLKKSNPSNSLIKSLEQRISKLESLTQKGMSFVTNPFGFLKNSLLGKAGLVGMAASFGIDLGQELFQILTSKNMPFDLHFRRIMKNEYDVLRSREYRTDVRLGIKQLIVNTGPGQKFNALYTFNNLGEVRNREIFAMDAFKIRKGSNY